MAPLVERLQRQGVPAFHHLMMGSSPGNLAELLFENRASVRRPARAAYCMAMSLAFSPLQVIEHHATNATVEGTPMTEPPVFVIGHWRTGTTYLHNLFACDPALGYVTTLQTTFPRMCVTWDWLSRPLVSLFGPATRPFDDLPFGPAWPQEEELGIANLTRHSWFHAIYFPGRMLDYFERYVTFDTATADEVEGWSQAFVWMLKKATLLAGGRRIVSKNPPNTARLPLLLRLFPDAKFVHIWRDPYSVFASTVHMHLRIARSLSFEHLDEERIRRHVLHLYRQMMQRYLDTYELVPPGNLVELRYEDLVRDPLRQMEAVYDGLGLDGFAAARPHMRRHVESMEDYRPNALTLDPAWIDEVSRAWDFAIERGGYPRRGR